MLNLFYNGQLAICGSNLPNLWNCRDRGLDVFPVNFPSLDGNGYVVSTSNGFCVFYLNIQDLLKGTKTPAEVAAAIDESCNAALEQGRPK